MGYLPKGGAQTNKDADGTPISVTKIGMSQSEFDKVANSSFDSIPGSVVLAFMVDEAAMSKNSIIKTPDNHYLYIHFWGDGKKWVEKLLPPNRDTEQYFLDLPADDQDYGFSIKIIKGNHVAKTFGKNGNPIDTYALLD